MSNSLIRGATRAGALILLVLGLAGCGVNAVPQQDEQVKAAWSQVLNEYQRRSDLVLDCSNFLPGLPKIPSLRVTSSPP